MNTILNRKYSDDNFVIIGQLWLHNNPVHSFRMLRLAWLSNDRNKQPTSGKVVKGYVNPTPSEGDLLCTGMLIIPIAQVLTWLHTNPAAVSSLVVYSTPA